MLTPEKLETVPDGTSLKHSLPIIINNNHKLLDDRQRLIWLQEWIKSQSSPPENIKENLM